MSDSESEVEIIEETQPTKKHCPCLPFSDEYKLKRVLPYSRLPHCSLTSVKLGDLIPKQAKTQLAAHPKRLSRPQIPATFDAEMATYKEDWTNAKEGFIRYNIHFGINEMNRLIGFHNRWLNGDIIELHLTVMRDRNVMKRRRKGGKSNLPHVYTGSPRIFTKLDMGASPEMAAMTLKLGSDRRGKEQRTNLFQFQILVFPCNVLAPGDRQTRDHWQLVTADLPKKEITGYCSLGRSVESAMNQIGDFINKEAYLTHFCPN